MCYIYENDELLNFLFFSFFFNLFDSKEIAPAMEAIDRALELFIRHYGNSNEEVLILMKMKACLTNA